MRAIAIGQLQRLGGSDTAQRLLTRCAPPAHVECVTEPGRSFRTSEALIDQPDPIDQAGLCKESDDATR
jgi:hypothetical protein